MYCIGEVVLSIRMLCEMRTCNDFVVNCDFLFFDYNLHDIRELKMKILTYAPGKSCWRRFGGARSLSTY